MTKRLNGASSTRIVLQNECNAALLALYAALKGMGMIPVTLPVCTTRPSPDAMSRWTNSCNMAIGAKTFTSNNARTSGRAMSVAATGYAGYQGPEPRVTALRDELNNLVHWKPYYDIHWFASSDRSDIGPHFTDEIASTFVTSSDVTVIPSRSNSSMDSRRRAVAITWGPAW